MILYRQLRPFARSAFTLVESLVVTAIMVLALGASLVAHFTGLRMHELVKSKIGASEDARKAINLLSTEIRSAKIIRVGTGSAEGFVEVADDQLQQGNALQVHPTTNLNSYIRYYLDRSDNRLKRSVNGSNVTTVVASFITNNLVFRSQDAFGHTLTNNQNNRVIDMQLEFYQIQYPIVRIGPGNYYDYYKLSTKITRRTLE